MPASCNSLVSRASRADPKYSWSVNLQSPIYLKSSMKSPPAVIIQVIVLVPKTLPTFSVLDAEVECPRFVQSDFEGAVHKASAVFTTFCTYMTDRPHLVPIPIHKRFVKHFEAFV